MDISCMEHIVNHTLANYPLKARVYKIGLRTHLTPPNAGGMLRPQPRHCTSLLPSLPVNSVYPNTPWVPLPTTESRYSRRPAFLPNPGCTRTPPNGPRPTHR